MNRKTKKIRMGVVVSDKMSKSVVVMVEKTITHIIYKRTLRSTKKYLVHDPESVCNPGDLVRIIECKPVSHMKRWRLLEVVEKAAI